MDRKLQTRVNEEREAAPSVGSPPPDVNLQCARSRRGGRYLPACSPPTGGSSPRSARGSTARRCSRSPWGRRRERAGWRCRLCRQGRLRGQSTPGEPRERARDRALGQAHRERAASGADTGTELPARGPGATSTATLTCTRSPRARPGSQGAAHAPTGCWASLSSSSLMA